MTKQTEAMKLALEALKQIDEAMPFPVAKLAQAALREALAEQPAQDEPVAWISTGPARMIHWTSDIPAYGDDWIPLYTSPPAQQEPVVFCMHWEDRWGCNHYADPKEPHPINSKPLYTSPPAQRTSPQAERAAWVGLTRAECLQIEKDMMKYYDYQHECKTVCLPEFSRAIEAKLKEKNT